MNPEVNGNRNLTLLGIGALILTVFTTSVSLWIYRSSGDIYLDRSRPGYLPDGEEADENSQASNSSYTFNDTGVLTKSELEEYLRELQVVNNRIQALADPYAPGPLSDLSLGIIFETREDDIKK